MQWLLERFGRCKSGMASNPYGLRKPFAHNLLMHGREALRIRCEWVTGDPLYIAYHDREWGVPVHDDRALFEFLLLEGAQAGLSWLTILRKRENYRRAFARFDARKIARFDRTKVEGLLSDPGIVAKQTQSRRRHRECQGFLAIAGRVRQL